jgi:protein unc-45
MRNQDVMESAVGGAVFSAIMNKSRTGRYYIMERINDEQSQGMRFTDASDRSYIDGLVSALTDKTLPRDIRKLQSKRQYLMFEKLLDALRITDSRRDRLTLAAITRLLAANPEELRHVVSSQGFQKILELLDIRLSDEMRSQATITTASFMEAEQQRAEVILNEFVRTQVSRGGDSSLIVAFSAASAIFPITPSVASALFLSKKFPELLVPLVKKKGEIVKRAALEMLSSACLDKSCRETIVKNCSEWLRDVIGNDSERNQGLAAVILAKLQNVGDASKAAKTPAMQEEELVNMFKKLMTKDDKDLRKGSIEGLAYSSLQPKVKEELAGDPEFLRSLISLLHTSPPKSNLAFGGYTILANLTVYAPKFTEEQKTLSQLKTYADASKPTAPSPLEDDKLVAKRCAAVLAAGAVPLFVSASKKVSPTVLALMINVLLALSNTSQNRGLIAQQGGLRILLASQDAIKGTTPSDLAAKRTAAQALARILVPHSSSTDPTHAFPNNIPVTSAVRPLLSLLPDPAEPAAESGPGGRQIFEALIALTNLATRDTVADFITIYGFYQLEDLLLSSDMLVQRATVELIVNLVSYSGEAIAKFADGSPAANRRMHILLALADAEDQKTRSASGGALVTVTEFDMATEAVLGMERGVKILLGLCEEKDEELYHRGILCVLNLVAPHNVEGQINDIVGERAIQKISKEGGVKILKDLLMTTKNEQVLLAGVEVLTKLAGSEEGAGAGNDASDHTVVVDDVD